MSQQRYRRITFEQAYDLCRRGQDVYCTYNGGIFVKVNGLPDTLSKYTHTFFVTEQLYRQLSTMNKRTPVQAFLESRLAQDAWLEGRPIQIKLANKEWIDYNGASPGFCNPSTEWRPKPEPVKVLFTQDTIPVDHWFRKIGTSVAHRITTIGESGVNLGYTAVWASYSALAVSFEHSPDRKTWHPCHTTES